MANSRIFSLRLQPAVEAAIDFFRFQAGPAASEAQGVKHAVALACRQMLAETSIPCTDGLLRRIDPAEFAPLTDSGVTDFFAHEFLSALGHRKDEPFYRAVKGENDLAIILPERLSRLINSR